MDGLDICVAVAVALSLVGLAAAIFWPMDRGDDVMQHVHGDQTWPQ